MLRRPKAILTRISRRAYCASAQKRASAALALPGSLDIFDENPCEVHRRGACTHPLLNRLAMKRAEKCALKDRRGRTTTPSPFGRRMSLLAGTVLILVSLAPPLAAQSPGKNPVAGALQPGKVTEKVVSKSDPSQSYAVFLPPAYRQDRRWPVLIAMDPRGRALVPLELFKPAAGRLGWIIVSSYNTLSDATWAPNEKAIRAILHDLPGLFSIDPRRLYFTGFSGTAKGAWSFANRLKPHVAGIIGFCGAQADFSKPQKGAPYSYFGASGRFDFNYEEMRAFDFELQEMGLPHRIEFFKGGHQWGPQGLCGEALEWMEVRAMKTKLVEVRPDFIASEFQDDLSQARELERSGHPYQAWRAYHWIAETFAGLQDVSRLSQSVQSLGKSSAVKKTQHHMDQLADRQRDFIRYLERFLGAVKFQSFDPLKVRQAQRDLRITVLQHRSSSDRDQLEADAARRLLEIAFVQVSFYGPRQYLKDGDTRRAGLLLDVADEIKPDNPRVLFFRARTEALAGNCTQAVALLRKLRDRGFLPEPGRVAEDPYLKLLLGKTEFQEFLEENRKGTTRKENQKGTSRGKVGGH